MASTGAAFPGTGENNASIGATAWLNPGNITADDVSTSTCAAAAGGSNYLVARNFGFSVPPGVTINGITVVFEMQESSAGTESMNVRLQDESGALIGNTKTQIISGAGLTIYTLGSSSDPWGANLTADIVNDPDFGVRFWYTTAHNIGADYVTVTVEYSVPQLTKRRRVKSFFMN